MLASPRISTFRSLRRRHGLKLRFMAVAAALLTFVVAAVSWLLLTSVKSSEIRGLRQRTADISRQFAASARVDILAGNRAGLEKLLRAALLNDTITTAEILSIEGETLCKIGGSTGADDEVSVQDLSHKPSRPDPTADGPAIHELPDRQDGTHLFEVLTPVMIREVGEEEFFDEGALLEESSNTASQATRLAGWVRLVGTDAPAVRHLEIVQARVLWLAIPLLFLCTLIVAFVLSRAVLVPLGKLLEAARKVTAGDLATQVPKCAQNEVGELADAFNSMVQALAASEHEIATRARELVQKNEALHQTTELLDGIIHSASDHAILGIDRNRRVVLYSEGARRTFGFDPDEVLGRGIERLVPALAGERALPENADGMLIVELEGRHVSGRTIALRASCSRRTDGRGEPVGHAILARDIASEKAAAELRLRNQELERVAALKTEFLARMSHELRTPLNAVIGFSQVLQDGILGPLNDDQQECLTSINESGNLLLRLINDILDLSKTEAGRAEVQPTTFSLEELVGSCLALVAPLADQKNQQIATHLATDLDEITSDEDHLRQILLNLLSNAIKFTRNDGTITVAARRMEGHVEVTVEDSGIGIACDDLPVIFESFHQLEGALRREHEGSGLGLSIVASFTELLGGRLWVESTPGKGTRFTLAVPIDVDRPETCRPHIPAEAFAAPVRMARDLSPALAANEPGKD